MDKSDAVEQTIDTEYLNTDHRMVAVPMLGTVTKDYFNTVTFAGTALPRAWAFTAPATTTPTMRPTSARACRPLINNVSVKNAVTGTTETPMETIVSSQPDYLYILVGTNNLVVQGSEDSFLAYYERLIDMLREQLDPGVKFYIQAIPGVQEDVVASKPGLDNTRIATVNDLLANMALRKGCYYINIREVLTNPADGSQIDDYATKDGVHFNACRLPCLGRLPGDPLRSGTAAACTAARTPTIFTERKNFFKLHKPRARCKSTLQGAFCTKVRKQPALCRTCTKAAGNIRKF